MRSISYRAKLRIRAGLKIGLICVAVLLAIMVIFLIYVQRYVVYTADGVKIDFGRSTAAALPESSGSTAPQVTVEDVQLIIGDGDSTTVSAAAVSGYYIDIAMLQDPEAVLAAVKTLETPCSIMIDLKSSSGNFYYATDIAGAETADIDVTVVEELLSYLKSNGFTVIARVEAFRDNAFALNNRSSALAISSGALWSDEGYYWLNPGDEAVLAYLQQIARELASKGIREIVFDDFYYPQSSSIVYNNEVTKTELMKNAAKELLQHFDSSQVTVSFGNPAADFAISSTTSHIMVPDADGSNLASILGSYQGVPNPETQVVFLTSSRDNRFDNYSCLRPLVQN